MILPMNKNGICILKTEPKVQTKDISQYLFDRKIIVSHLIEKGGSLEKQFLKILAENESSTTNWMA